jgi:3-oxoacyl-[acyl-carrier protein] reductase
MIEANHTEAEMAELIAAIPVGRLCEPEEFGHCVKFLASDLAGFITGEIIDQNGGMHMD